MKVLMVGAGGIGGNLAVRLAQRAPHATYVLARDAQAEAIRRHGLRLELAGETREARPLVVTSLRDAPEVDLVVLAVKDFALSGVLDELARYVRPGMSVLPLLNGLPRAAGLRERLGGATVFEGCIYVASERAGPGLIRQVSPFCRILFRGLPEDESTEAHVRTLLASAGVECPPPADIVTDVWRKFLFVCPLAGVSSYFGLGIRATLEHPEARELLEASMREVEALAHACGVALPADAVEQALRTAASFPPEARTSMQLDLQHGRPLELEAFSGAVVRLAQAKGLDAPAHRRIYAHLSPLAAA